MKKKMKGIREREINWKSMLTSAYNCIQSLSVEVETNRSLGVSEIIYSELK